MLANGKTVEAVGQITSSCAFGLETDVSVSMSCVFYVLLKVVTPIIMGMQFLKETETLTKHRERFVRVQRPALQALSVCSLDSPRHLLSCNLDYKPTTATPDTGSEINLISPRVASEFGMHVYPAEELLELADGSVVVTSGYVRASLSIGNNLISTNVDFYLLQGLTHRIIIGEETLEELRIFTDHQNSLITAFTDYQQSGLNTIRCRGTVERCMNRIKDVLGIHQPSPNSKGAIFCQAAGAIVQRSMLISANCR